MTGLKDKVETEEKSSLDYLKNARDIAFVIGIFLFFAGWLYIYFYLNGFGIPLKAADLDIYNILIYAVNVFLFCFNFGRVYLIILLIIVVAGAFFENISALVKKIIPVGIILMFPLIFSVSRNAAQYDCKNALFYPLQHLKNIVFVFKDDSNLKTDKQKKLTDSSSFKYDMSKQNENENLFLVAVNKEEYFVLSPRERVTETNLKFYIPTIYIIKKESVELAKIFTKDDGSNKISL